MNIDVNRLITGAGAARVRPGLRYYVGVDLGQRRDPTAIAVVEREEVAGSRRDPVTWALEKRTVYAVRYLERMPLDLCYVDVVERVGRLVRNIRMVTKCELVVDATGVGAPIIDMLRRAKMGCNLSAVTITGGDRQSQDASGWRVPKRDLVTGLQALFETGELQVARELEDSEKLLQELREMKVRVSLGGHESFEAWREGAHDDLVLAVALACWKGRRV